jgi:hypothetical protein
MFFKTKQGNVSWFNNDDKGYKGGYKNGWYTPGMLELNEGFDGHKSSKNRYSLFIGLVVLCLLAALSYACYIYYKNKNTY